VGRVADPGSDPIFHQEEPVERPVRARALVFQFFLVPLMIVLAAVGVYLFFGSLAGSRDSPSEYLDAVMTGGDNLQKQAAHQLGILIAEERARIDAGKDPDRAPFWNEAGFRERLRRAFVESFPDESVERQVFLAFALGQVGDPSYLDTLKEHLGPGEAPEVRRAVVQAIGLLPGPAVVPTLVGLLEDKDEPVRNLAVAGLARPDRRDDPLAREGLRRALEDPSDYVKAHAGAALALVGDASGREWVEHLLDPAWVERKIAAPSASGGAAATAGAEDRAALRRAYLANGIRGALGLRDESLRPRVEALLEDDDGAIRALARDALDRWKKA
jgi:HEAT repeats